MCFVVINFDDMGVSARFDQCGCTSILNIPTAIEGDSKLLIWDTVVYSSNKSTSSFPPLPCAFPYLWEIHGLACFARFRKGNADDQSRIYDNPIPSGPFPWWLVLDCAWTIGMISKKRRKVRIV